MTPPVSATPPGARGNAQRAVGFAMLGSAIALAVVAALAYGGVLPVDPAVRGWMAAGAALAAVIDGGIGFYFLRAASQS